MYYQNPFVLFKQKYPNFWNKNIHNLFSEFCPVYCNLSTEYNCPGQWKIEDGKWIEQLTPDFCQPRKVEIAGIGECENYCDYQIACFEGMKLCSDMIDPYQKNPDGSLKGCKLHPWCMPADEECPEIFSF